MARASSCSCRHGTRSGRSPGEADPTNVTVPPPSAAASIRVGTEVTAASTRAATKGLPTGERPVGSRVAGPGEGGRMTQATVVLVNGMGSSPAAWSPRDAASRRARRSQRRRPAPEWAVRVGDGRCRVRSITPRRVGRSRGPRRAFHGRHGGDRSGGPSDGEASRLSRRGRCSTSATRCSSWRRANSRRSSPRALQSQDDGFRAGHGRVRRVLHRSGGGPPPTRTSSCSGAARSAPPRRCWRTLRRRGGRFRPPSCPVTTAR